MSSQHKGKGNCHKIQIFVCGELVNFLKEIVALKKCREFLPQKFNGPRLGRYPGRRYSFTLAIWICTSVALKSTVTVFQSNLYCKTIIRLPPSFRKNLQHFLLISLLDLILHTEPMMITENLKKSIRGLQASCFKNRKYTAKVGQDNVNIGVVTIFRLANTSLLQVY